MRGNTIAEADLPLFSQKTKNSTDAREERKEPGAI
jgi:hypothetical protein